MEKISGIIPSSSRVSSVDMREAAPVRPGTPAFGRAEGVSSLRDAKVGQTAGRAVKLSQEQLDWKSKDMKNAATVRELSDRFFKNNDRPAGSAIENVTEGEVNSAPLGAARPSVAAGFDTDSLDRTTGSGVYAGATSMDSAMDEVKQPEGLHPRGSFVDVRA